MLGRVVVVSLFVGRDGRGWTERETADAHDTLLRAGAWIENEAIRHGAAVNIELADTYFVFDDAAPDDVAIAFHPEGNDVGPAEEACDNQARLADGDPRGGIPRFSRRR